ncbi:MAG: hypothetical protein ACO280_05525 [Pseudohongiellaceae bacterium]
MASSLCLVRRARYCLLISLVGVCSAATAQFSSDPPPYVPAAEARDLKAVLFNWTWQLGMLRGIDEHELIASLEYQGSGTLSVRGQACTIDSYRVSTNYQLPGQRVQYSCSLPDGNQVTAVEVVNWQQAWDEDRVGAGLLAGEGSVTPRPEAVAERLIRLWASPQGAPKAALAGAGQPDPHRLPDDGEATIGATSVAWVADHPQVSFPIPGVPGASAVATLDARFMAERVVVTHGSSRYEFRYADYQDWNNPLNKVEVLYAGTSSEWRDGVLQRDLRTVVTETGSVYVVMPVPAAVQAVHPVATVAPPPVAMPPPPPARQGPAPATPRLGNEKPDLSGNWASSGMNWRYGFRRCGPSQVDCSPTWNQTIDFEFEAPSRYGPNRPLYKPQYWDRVQQLDMWTNREDPVMTCQPLGIPRQGPPRRIIQSENDIVFFYAQYADGGGGYGEYRIMPIDGRPHDPAETLTTRYMGYTVGRWEEDTLVLESIAFNDYTWLARGGFFHSDKMRVTERLTRNGDEILYEVTVDDPEVLLEPWVMTPRVLRLNGTPDAGLLPERGNCEVYELEDITSQIRH